MKRVLYACDFSENSRLAFTFALQFARVHQAELHFLHVLDFPSAWDHPYSSTPQVMEWEEIQQAKERLHTFLFSFANSDAVSSFFHVRMSLNTTKGIMDQIDETKPDLLVMGTKGANKIKEVLIGSTTKSLITQACIPVLAIPQTAVFSEMKRVLFMSDILKSDFGAISWLVSLLKPFQSIIQVVHLSTHFTHDGERMFQHKEQLLQKIDYEHLQFSNRLFDSFLEGLEFLLNEEVFDLLGMVEKEKNGFFDRIFHSDLVKKMEVQTKIPLLSIPESL